MKLFLSLLLTLSLLPPPLYAARPALLDSVKDLAAFMRGPDGEMRKYRICSVGMVNDVLDLVLTAAHCVVGEDGEVVKAALFVDGKRAMVVEVDVEKDLAILAVPTLNARPLKLSNKPLVVGDYVETAGYPGAIEKFWFAGKVSRANHKFDGSTQRFVLFDMAVLGGQSGSPIVNERGELVSVMQIGLGTMFESFMKVSGGCLLSDLRMFVGKFMEKG